MQAAHSSCILACAQVAICAAEAGVGYLLCHVITMPAVTCSAQTTSALTEAMAKDISTLPHSTLQHSLHCKYNENLTSYLIQQRPALSSIVSCTTLATSCLRACSVNSDSEDTTTAHHRQVMVKNPSAGTRTWIKQQVCVGRWTVCGHAVKAEN